VRKFGRGGVAEIAGFGGVLSVLRLYNLSNVMSGTLRVSSGVICADHL
jgi:hypothetical protein